MTDKQYCPTRGGSFTGYEPQWRHPVDGWIAIPLESGMTGIPFPQTTGGSLSTIGQALAIADAFAAVGEANGKVPEVCIQPYRIHYDIKAEVMENDEEPLP